MHLRLLVLLWLEMLRWGHLASKPTIRGVIKVCWISTGRGVNVYYSNVELCCVERRGHRNVGGDGHYLDRRCQALSVAKGKQLLLAVYRWRIGNVSFLCEKHQLENYLAGLWGFKIDVLSYLSENELN